MSQRNTVAHFMHDVGLAAWFGGSLMGAIGVNGAAADVDDPRQAARVANSGWARWTPFNAAAIGMHLLGGARLMQANKGRVATQKGVLGNTAVKLGLTAGALGATAYSRMLGQKVMNAGDVPVAGGTEPTIGTPPEVAKAQKQLKALQWAIPGLTGAVLASSSLHEEQQRPSQVLKGELQKLPSLAAGVSAVAGAKALDAAHAGADQGRDGDQEGSRARHRLTW
jgi:enoyl-CoA hydratase/carnithine racemase